MSAKVEYWMEVGGARERFVCLCFSISVYVLVSVSVHSISIIHAAKDAYDICGAFVPFGT